MRRTSCCALSSSQCVVYRDPSTCLFFFLMIRPPPTSTLFPYTTLFRSYGGYTTLIALSRWPDIWRAGVNLFGVVNLKTFMATTSGLIRQIFLTEFGDPDKDAEFLAQISPLTDVGKIVDPTFVYAGANDPRVPRTESDLIVKALREKGVPSEYMVAANEGHSLARRETQVEYYG